MSLLLQRRVQGTCPLMKNLSPLPACGDGRARVGPGEGSGVATEIWAYDVFFRARANNHCWGNAAMFWTA